MKPFLILVDDSSVGGVGTSCGVCCESDIPTCNATLSCADISKSGSTRHYQ
jgi:hypothetical protein